MNLEGAIRAQLPRAREVTAGLSAEHINWRPVVGAWSIAECLAHLNTLNALYADSIRAAIKEASGLDSTRSAKVQKLGVLERSFLSIIEPPYRLKFKAPSMFRPNGATFDRDDLLAAWNSTHERLAQLAAESSGLDLKAVKIRSPATPLFKMTLLCALMMTPAHDRRHLWQAERVRELLKATRSAA